MNEVMAEVKEKLIGLLVARLDSLGLDASDVNGDLNLITTGILDSVSFLEFIAEVEDELGIELDFGELDPSNFTSIGALAKIIESRNG